MQDLNKINNNNDEFEERASRTFLGKAQKKWRNEHIQLKSGCYLLSHF